MGIQHSDILEWGFAGVSSNDIITRKGQPVFHGSWRHLIDSRFLDGDAVKDEGEMIPMEMGKTLEKGKMVNPLNPAAGEQPYEEGWADVPILSQRDDGKLEMAVLQLMEDEVGTRGMVIRIGQVCQGIIRVREDYACERWLWTKEEGWKRVLRDGGLWLPTGLAMDCGKLELGDDVKHLDFPWKVVELGSSD